MKLLGILFISFISFNSFSQRESNIYFIDVQVGSDIVLSYLDSIQSILISQFDSGEQVDILESYIRYPYSKTEYTTRLATPHIQTHSYRIYLSINREFNQIAIIGFARNIIYNKMLDYNRGNLITTEPLFVIPLIEHKKHLPELEFEKLSSLISRLLLADIVDENILFLDKQHIPTLHTFIADYPTIKLFINPMRLLNSGISGFSYPNEQYQLSQDEVYSYPMSDLSKIDSSGIEYNWSYQRQFLGLSYVMNFERSTEVTETSTNFDSATVIQFSNSYKCLSVCV